MQTSAKPLGVRGELDPCRTAARLDGIGPAADDEVRVEASNFLPERGQPGGHYLDVRAVRTNSARHELSVGAVFVLEGY